MNHFVQWLERRPDVEQPVDPAGFVSRRLYGEYVAATLDEAVGVAAEGVVLHKRTGADVVGVGRVASAQGERYLPNSCFLSGDLSSCGCG